MQIVFLYAVPRSGTNLIGALLHNHRAVAARSHGATKRALLEEPALLERLRGGAAPASELESIYPLADFAKPREVVSHLLFDKIHWTGKHGFGLLEAADAARRDKGDRGVVLMRNPFGILLSRQRFHEKWGRPEWSLETAAVDNFFANEFVPTLKLARAPDTFCVASESVSYQPERVLEALQAWLGLAPQDGVASFQDSFAANAPCHGEAFTTGESDVVHSTFLRRRGAKMPMRPHYQCPGCGQPVVGFGGFNPHEPISHSRQTVRFDAFPQDALKRVVAQTRRHLGEPLTRFFQQQSAVEHGALAPALESFDPPRSWRSFWPLRRK